MSHLKCEKHDRRVVVLDDNSATVLHRSDGSHCAGRGLRQGWATLTAPEVLGGLGSRSAAELENIRRKETT
jgi:hypothetical protein